MPSIRFIVETIRAWDKVNGHSYRAAYITATATGRRLFVCSVGGDDNIRGDLGRLVGVETYPQVFSYQREVTKRELRRIEAQHEKHGRVPMEMDLTREMVEALEVETPAE